MNVYICVCMIHLHMYVLVHLFIGVHGGQRRMSDALSYCSPSYFLKIQSLTECGISMEPESSSNPLLPAPATLEL